MNVSFSTGSAVWNQGTPEVQVYVTCLIYCVNVV
jgi:hypothetical protein